MLDWLSRFNIFCFLDNQQYAGAVFECLAGAGCAASFAGPPSGALDAFLSPTGAWRFGHLCYELKEPLHGIVSPKKDPVGFRPLFFFEPEAVLFIRDGQLHIRAEEPERIYRELQEQPASPAPAPALAIRQRLERDQYLEKIRQLQAHIRRGDCYEINFCQEFYCEDAAIDPVSVFSRLMAVSPNPFSALYRNGSQWLLCASPERFLKKEGRKLISQPIKGTIRRDRLNPAHDAALREALAQSRKDQAENVMIVDLVRNDLSRICTDRSVQVDELFGIYSYPQVHQMISTISGELREDVPFSGILRALFPMGSMTGAPKHRVMQLIDRYEEQHRGIFSGSVGYMAPNGDFDFNVVIRSLMYNAATGYLGYQVGSGITIYSQPEAEWEECLLKGEAIKKVLTGASTSNT